MHRDPIERLRSDA